MPKPGRLLTLLHLLSHRRAVSLDTIKSVCGIPERSVYRYLNALSEASIPVYFDKDHGGYCLAGPVDMRLDDLTLQEVVILITSLRIVQEHVNPLYRGELKHIMERLLSRQPFTLEAISQEQDRLPSSIPPEPDFSQDLSLALAQAAISEGRKLTLHLHAPDASGQSTVEISEPRLAFDKSWGVSGFDPAGNPTAKLGEIARILIA